MNNYLFPLFLTFLSIQTEVEGRGSLIKDTKNEKNNSIVNRQSSKLKKET